MKSKLEKEFNRVQPWGRGGGGGRGLLKPRRITKKFGWELEFGQSQIKSSTAAWLQISTSVKRKSTTVTLMLTALTL